MLNEKALQIEIERLKELAAGGWESPPHTHVHQKCQGAYNVLCALEDWLERQPGWTGYPKASLGGTNEVDFEYDEQAPDDPDQVRWRKATEEGYNNEDDTSVAE